MGIDHFKKLTSRLAGLNEAAFSSLGAPPIPSLSISSNRFTIKDADGQEQTLDQLYIDLIFIDANPKSSKVYYEEGYSEDPKNRKPPVCFSDNGIGPSINAQVPQSLDGTCVNCPKNQFTKPSPRDPKVMLKWCSDKKKTAVLIPETRLASPFQFILPWAAHKSFKEFGTRLANYENAEEGVAKGDLTVAHVITRVSLPGPKDMLGKLEFGEVAFVNEEWAEAILAALNNGSTRLLCGLDDKPRALALAGPAPGGNGGVQVSGPSSFTPAPAHAIAPIQLPQNTPALAGLHPNAETGHQAQLEAERAAIQAEREALAAERQAMQAGPQEPPAAVEGASAKPKRGPGRPAKGAPPPDGAPLAPRQPTFGAGSTTAITPGSPVGDQVRARIGGLFKPKN